MRASGTGASGDGRSVFNQQLKTGCFRLRVGNMRDTRGTAGVHQADAGEPTRGGREDGAGTAGIAAEQAGLAAEQGCGGGGEAGEDKVRRRAAERGAVILAHNSQRAKTQEAAAHVGDSLALARLAAA